MPFRALQEGTIVSPAMVQEQEPVICPECEGTMYVRDGPDRARHFVHSDHTNRESCPGPAESKTHARCVALAVEALQEAFHSQASRCGPEIELDVSMSASHHRVRRADALVEFATENAYFGKGLVVEVQHRNQQKDVQLTTHDYLSAGYSIVWLSSDVFGDQQLDYSIVDDAFSSSEGSGYSVREHSPNVFLSCLSCRHNGEHNWGTVPAYVLTVEEDYEICTSPGCTLRRQHDERLDEYVYESDSITVPDLPLRVLQNALVRDTAVTDLQEWLTQRYHSAVLEKALASRPEIGPCSGPKGFHEWTPPTEEVTGKTGRSIAEVRACQHCSVHLLTDFRGRPEEWDYLFLSDAPEPEWDLLSLKADPWQCNNRSHEEGEWYESCPECGLTNP